MYHKKLVVLSLRILHPKEKSIGKGWNWTLDWAVQLGQPHQKNSKEPKIRHKKGIETLEEREFLHLV